MLKVTLIPNVLPCDADELKFGWTAIQVCGKKLAEINGETSSTYNSALMSAIIAGIKALKRAAEITIMLLVEDYKAWKNKSFVNAVDQNLIDEYQKLSETNKITIRKLPEDFALPETREAKEEVINSIASCFSEPVEDEEPIVENIITNEEIKNEEDKTMIIETIKRNMQKTYDELYVLGTALNKHAAEETIMSSVEATNLITSVNEIIKNLENNNIWRNDAMKPATINTVTTKNVSVYWLMNNQRNSKTVTIEEANAFLPRADERKVAAYYVCDGKNVLNKTASAMKKPAAQPVKAVAAPVVAVTNNSASIPTVDLWVDGACSGNGTEKAKAGYGYVLVMGDHRKEGKGLVTGKQTNNRAELAAVIEGLACLKKHCNVIVHTDSQVVTRAPKIIERGYKTSDNKEPANKDLLEKLAEHMEKHDVTIVKVAGHAGIELNESCDALARAAAAEANT